MPRPTWSGTISFGLINIPVRLYNAVKESEIKFHLLRKNDLCPIKYVRVCRDTSEQVDYQKIVRGYEYNKGRYVVIEDAEFKKVNPKKTQSIEIISFVREEEIDQKSLEKPFYIEPDRGADKTYALFREGLKKSGKVGLAKFVLKTREYIGLVKPEKNFLILEQIRYSHELKKPEELNLNVPGAKKTFSTKEMEFTLELIEKLSAPFQPEKLRDTYTVELKKYVNKKIAGKTPESKEFSPAPTQYVDIMDKLMKSIEQARKTKAYK